MAYPPRLAAVGDKGPAAAECKMARKNGPEFWLLTIVLVVILIGVLVVVGRLAL
jgi:hypothetical protein